MDEKADNWRELIKSCSNSVSAFLVLLENINPESAHIAPSLCPMMARELERPATLLRRMDDAYAEVTEVQPKSEA